MKKYNTPELSVTFISSSDIITTSGLALSAAQNDGSTVITRNASGNPTASALGLNS